MSMIRRTEEPTDPDSTAKCRVGFFLYFWAWAWSCTEKAAISRTLVSTKISATHMLTKMQSVVRYL